MIREKDVKKYDDKYQLDDTDNRLLKEEDDDYFINHNRPVSDKTIKSLPKTKLNQFIKDIMLNKEIINVLYSTNSNIEIKHHIKSNNSLERKLYVSNTKAKTRTKSKKIKDKKSTLGREWARKEAYCKLSLEIKQHNEEKKNTLINLHKSNERKYMVFRTQSTQDRNADYDDPVKKRRKNEFLKTFYSIKNKFDLYNRGREDRNEENVDNDNNLLVLTRLNSEGKLSSNNPTHGQYTKTISLPDIKLDKDNVYSRLYHNSVCVSAANVFLTNTKYNTIDTSTAPNTQLKIKGQQTKQQSHSQLQSSTTNINRITRKTSSMSSNNKDNSDSRYHHSPHKPLLNIKKVSKISDGKEFTIKNQEDLFKKCFFKYSGGPKDSKMIRKQIDADIKSHRELNENKIDFYKITTENGNYLLHIITIENQVEMAKYFLDKGADPNIQNMNGDTPLHIATRNQYYDIITLLLEHGAKTNIYNNKKETAFDLATTVIRSMFPSNQNSPRIIV